jgi:hypothetical protein
VNDDVPNIPIEAKILLHIKVPRRIINVHPTLDEPKQFLKSSVRSRATEADIQIVQTVTAARRDRLKACGVKSIAQG